MAWLSGYSYQKSVPLVAAGSIAGTIAVTGGSNAVVGTNTFFLQWGIGDKIQLPDSSWYTIATVTDNTHLTISVNYPGSNASGQTYDMRLINYQMKLSVGESSGATGEAVDCGGKCQSGFHDIEFTTSDGTTLLKWFIESITGISPNQLATIWIKFDSIGTGDTTFYMYYGSSTLPDPIDVPTTCQWKRYPNNPVLVVGAAGKWDDFWVQFNTIWKEGNTYYGYYQGSKSDGKFGIGLATSTDGITWTKDPTADGKVLDVGAGAAWDNYLVGYPMVWKEGNTWYMIYAGKHDDGNYQFGLATSSDGVTWNKDVSWTNPVYADTAWMEPGTTMLKEGDTYYLYYSRGTGWGSGLTIRLATSTNLTSWTASPNNPMISGGGTGAWDCAITGPTVIKFGSTYYMWYEGAAYDGGAYGHSCVGVATSANKDSGWSKAAGNPVLGTGGGTAWDNCWSEVGILVNFGTEWRMYYGGSQGNVATPRCQAGFATYAKKGVGADTFILFDDFERVPYAAVGGSWTVAAGAPVISLDQSYGGARSCKMPATADMNIPQALGNNIAIRYRIYKIGTADILLTTSNGTKGMQLRAKPDEHVDFYNGAAYTDLGALLTIDTWQLLEISDIVLGTSLDIWVNGSRVSNNGACNWNTNQSTNVLRFSVSAGPSYLENVIVRNYRTTEPDWGNWGDETTEAVDVTVDIGLQSGSKTLFSVSENTDQVLNQGLITKAGSLFSPSFILDHILTQNLQTGSKTIFSVSNITDQILGQNLLSSITSVLSVLLSTDQVLSVNVIPGSGSPYDVTVVIPGIAVTVDLGLLLAIGSALETLLQTDQVLSQGIIEKLGSVFASSQNTDQVLQQKILSALGAVLASPQFFDMTIYLNALSALASIYQILVQIKAAPENFKYLNLKLELPPALPEGGFTYKHSS